MCVREVKIIFSESLGIISCKPPKILTVDIENIVPLIALWLSIIEDLGKLHRIEVLKNHDALR